MPQTIVRQAGRASRVAAGLAAASVILTGCATTGALSQPATTSPPASSSPPTSSPSPTERSGKPSSPAASQTPTTQPSAVPSRPAATGDDIARAAEQRVFFGHQSVGANIIDGLPSAFKAFDVDGPDLVETRRPTGRGPAFTHASIGNNGDPLGKIADFVSVVKAGAGKSVDVALMKLCYIDFDVSTDVEQIFEAYAAAMDGLEKAYPEVTFLYTTTPVTTEGQTGVPVTDAEISGLPSTARAGLEVNGVRESYNTLVRERYQASGRLFDIAAVGSRINDDKVMAQQHDGHYHYSLNPDLSYDGAHFNERGGKALATELLRLIGTNAD